MILSHVSLKLPGKFHFEGKHTRTCIGGGFDSEVKISSYPHFYGGFNLKMTFVQSSFYQEPKCIGLNQALEYSPLSPPTILFRHSQITTMSSYQKVNIGQYTYKCIQCYDQLVWGISANQNFEVSDTDATIVLRFEKGRISQSNVGTLLVLPGTTVLLFKDKHEK